MNLRLSLLAICILISPMAGAQFDVDDADSLDFERFHSEKNGRQADTEKTWKTAPKPERQQQGQHTEISTSSAFTFKSATTAASANNRFTLDEEYDPGDLPPSLSSVTAAIAMLHQRMAVLCPRGWHKEAERSRQDRGQWILEYTISCM